MKTILVFFLFVASSLCYPGWGDQAQGQGGYIPSGGNLRQAEGGWGGVGGQQRGMGGAQGAGWRGSRSSGGDSQYGATIIDTPDMYGYEANIPGAHTKFVNYRGARSGGHDQQSPQGQGQGSSGHSPWSQGGRQY